MKPMRKQMIGSVFLALLVLLGCKPPTRVGGLPRPREEVYLNIVSLSPSTSEMIAMAGVQLKGRTNACNYPTSILDAKVVADLKPNYEQLALIKPDLIVIDRDLYGDAEVAKLKQVARKVHIIGSDTVEAYIMDFYVLGNMISGEAPINEYIFKLQKQVRAASGEPPLTPQKSAIIIPDASGHHMIAGTKSFQGDVARIIGSPLVGPESNRFEPLNAEFLVAQNPTVIFVAGDPKGFVSDPRFANLRAVKESKVIELDPDLCLRRGSRVDQFVYLSHKKLLLAVEDQK